MPASKRRNRRPTTRAAGVAAAVAAALALAACSTAILSEGGSLARYDRLVPTSNTTFQGRLYADPGALAQARTVRIVPTAFPAVVAGPGLTPQERRLVANAADRALCYELSLRYDIVSDRDADLVVRAQVTRVETTDLGGAAGTLGIATAASIAAQAGTNTVACVARLPIPRIPVGLGSLTVEGEALDRRRQQRAALVWGGGVNALTSRPRYSQASDAYDLAGEFGRDLGFLVATGRDPLTAPLTLPDWNRLRVTRLGEAPLDPDCEAFGRAPGLDGMIGDSIGIAPQFTDRGPRIP